MRAFVIFALGFALILPFAASAQSVSQAVSDRQAALQAQLDQIQAQIAAQQNLLDAAQAQHQTLQSQINILDAEIKKTQLQIQAINLTITQLNGNITVHNNTLASLAAQLNAEKESLAQILRQTQMLDGYSAVEVALSSQDVSGFFADLDAFASVQASLADSFNQIQHTSSTTESEKEALEVRLAEQEQLQQEAQLAKRAVQAQEAQKQQLLTQTKGQEAAYQKLIASNKQTAAQIRAQLFTLQGSAAIPFGTALSYAESAQKATGVRAAFILGILKQESNLGANVGQCLLTNVPNQGDGKSKNTGALIRGVMKPSRDVGPFMQITTALGLDWQQMPVSCPQGSGYGGAMGPAQFIPSTWNTYQARIARLAGHPGTEANPWDNLDAFTAIALYMTDLGAATQNPADERLAALKYFAGSFYRNPAFSFYGDGVMQFAAQFQQQIDILGGA